MEEQEIFCSCKLVKFAESLFDFYDCACIKEDEEKLKIKRIGLITKEEQPMKAVMA